MEALLDWGITTILWVQQFSPTLDLPFKVFTLMGEEVFFTLLIFFVYWCIDRSSGVRLAILFLLSGYINTVAKVLAGQPRPFEYNSQVHKLFEADGGGLPSGHTQNTVVIWGELAFRFRMLWLWLIALFLMLLVPISRVYLGLHFPTDLVGGYLLGFSILLLYRWLEPGVAVWLKSKGLTWQLSISLALPALMILLFPSNEKNGLIAGATLMGMGAGFVVEQHFVKFQSGGIRWKKVVRFLLGTAVAFTLWQGLGATFFGLQPESLYRFLQYGLVGLWAALGAPWIFVKLRLAGSES
jgi:membrane-associated phospholipid phosphatase